VLNAQGRISLMRSGSGAGLTQRLRLEQEGVRFSASGRVDLKVCGWRPAAVGRRGAPPRRRSA